MYTRGQAERPDCIVRTKSTADVCGAVCSCKQQQKKIPEIIELIFNNLFFYLHLWTLANLLLY